MDIKKELLFVVEVLIYGIPIILAIIGYFKLIQYYKKRGVKNIVKIDKTIQFSFCILCWFLFLNPSTIKHKDEGSTELITKFNKYGYEKIGLGRLDLNTSNTIYPKYIPIDYLDSIYMDSYLGTFVPKDLVSTFGEDYFKIKELAEKNFDEKYNKHKRNLHREPFSQKEYWEKKIERKNFYLISFTKLNVDDNHKYIIGFGVFEMIFIFDKSYFIRID
jgi:hypothetical protein